MKPGVVVFAGAGPGAPDLLTLRCRDALAAADVVVSAGSLVNPAVLDWTRPDCRLHDSAGMDLAHIMDILIAAARAGKRVLRLHTGDPSLYGAVAEQMRALDAVGIPYEVIPGVSSIFAGAAALKAELTLPGISQTVVMTRRAGRTPVPPGQDIAALAAHRATMAIFLSADGLAALVKDLRAGGYPADTPAAVVYRASWPDERIVTGMLGDIADQVAAAGITRQAIVLVGDALRGQGEASRLYAADFSHGYRKSKEPTDVAGDALPDACPFRPGFIGAVAVYALTATGARVARRLAGTIGGTLFLSRERCAADETDRTPVIGFEGRLLESVVAQQWRRFAGHVFVMAAGIVVRKIAPLLTSKTEDPAVVVCDEEGRYAISLLSGHIGGANRLAQDVAAALDGQAVVTTATDVQGVMAFDELAARYGWRIENPAVVKTLNSLLLAREKIGLGLPDALVRQAYGSHEHLIAVDAQALPADLAGLVVLDQPHLKHPAELPVLHLARPAVALGIGCNRGTSADEIETAVQSILHAEHIAAQQVDRVASIDLKREEAGLLAFAARHQWPLVFFSPDELDAVPVPQPSSVVAQATGSRSVAEAAAIVAAGGGRLIVPKRKHGAVTVAVAVRQTSVPAVLRGRIFAIGIGAGTPAGLTSRARTAVLAADVIAGYRPYCEQIAWLTGGKRVLATGMGDEVRRCQEAIAEAQRGHTVAVISSGDAGVYGMAGLLLELVAECQADCEVEVVPGVTSALEAAAALGAPLANDYAAISLSDLLTPRATILARLRAVAACGLTCALYNPRSGQRQELFSETLRIFSAARGDDAPAGFVKDAGRPSQTIWIGPLRDLPVERVDMSTLVIIGGAETRLLNGRLVTLRGYPTTGDGRTPKALS
jgi:cobalt-precorrin 5A hydrolase/precorrin-3B C17-methyltransferase